MDEEFVGTVVYPYGVSLIEPEEEENEDGNSN